MFGRPHQLTGNHHGDFLLHDLPKLLEDVPLAVRAPMWHMRDCAWSYFILAMLDVLNNTYTIHKLNISGHMILWTLFLVLLYEIRDHNLSAPFSYSLYIEVHGICCYENFILS
jgi:hypothetical protein